MSPATTIGTIMATFFQFSSSFLVVDPPDDAVVAPAAGVVGAGVGVVTTCADTGA